MLHKLKRMLTDKMGQPILQYFDEQTLNYHVQPKIATEESVANDKILLNQKSSREGQLVKVGMEWESEMLKTDGRTMITLYTLLASQGLYEVALTPSLDGINPQLSQKTLIIGGDVTSNKTVSKRMYAPYIQVSIKNLSTNDMQIGVFVYATK